MMNNNIENITRRAKLKLFTNELIFFGMCVNKFKWVTKEMSSDIEGYVIFNKKDLSKLEIGTIWLNSQYLSRQDYSHINLTYLLCHELLHILNKHGIRRGNRIHEVWAVACDHVIENYLKLLSHIIRPYQNHYNIVDDLNIALPNCSAEQAYDWLIANQHLVNIKLKSQNENNNGDEPNIIEVSSTKSKKVFEISSNIGGIDNSSDEEMNPIIIHQTEQLVAESRAIFENLKQKGNIPSYLKTYLDMILRVDIPWERLVEKAIKTNIIMKPDDRSWHNLNKFFMPHNINLPGYSLSEARESVGKLIIGLDSSGSINDKNLKQFSSVIENSMMYFKETHLLVHDIDIHQRRVFDKDNIFSFYEFIKKEGYQGRGGTSHKYLFDEIEEKYWKEDKDDLSMVICLTDNYSDIHYIHKRYEWIKNNIPFVIIITANGKMLNFEEKIGDIIQIKINN